MNLQRRGLLGPYSLHLGRTAQKFPVEFGPDFAYMSLFLMTITSSRQDQGIEA
jgi:hypothetical protein